MLKRLIAALLFSMVIVSCSSSPEEMIVGTWNFKAIHCDQTVIDTYGQAYIDGLDSTMSTVMMEFGKDGSYRSYFKNMPSEVHGTYTSNGDGTFSIHAIQNGTTQDGIVTRVDEHELVVTAQGWAYLMVR